MTKNTFPRLRMNRKMIAVRPAATVNEPENWIAAVQPYALWRRPISGVPSKLPQVVSKYAIPMPAWMFSTPTISAVTGGINDTKPPPVKPNKTQ